VEELISCEEKQKSRGELSTPERARIGREVEELGVVCEFWGRRLKCGRKIRLQGSFECQFGRMEEKGLLLKLW
jgi:hypothetical protein